MEIIVVLLVVIADQFSKKLAVKYLMNQKPIEVIKNFMELHYVKNFGAAFGILQNQRIFFIIMTSLVLGGLAGYLFKNSEKLTLFAKLAISLLIGGALGNLIDRIRHGYVVDFIKVDLKIYNFPVFNVADMFIVVGTALLIFVVVFDRLEINMGVDQ
ncbi:MAG: signal peptidase II [Gudongella sp.]|nr:signal peptidase II [Gudongella sp.]